MKKAHCDISTGKIYNAEPNTFEYFHEEGHINYNDKFSEKIMIKQYADILITGFVVVCLFLLFINQSVARVLSYGAIIIFGYRYWLEIQEELWCNNYARKKMEELCKTNK